MGGASARVLRSARAVVTATATSSNCGSAKAVSKGLADGSKAPASVVVNTGAISTNCGNAVAEKTVVATGENKTASVLTQADGNNTVTFESESSPSSGANATEEITQVYVSKQNGTTGTQQEDGDLKKPAGSWESAPACPHLPTLKNSVQDMNYRLWGYANNGSCAFKAEDNVPLYYEGYVRITFEDSPACKDSSIEQASKDALGRYWGFELEKNCAFKDAQGKPLTRPEVSEEAAGPLPETEPVAIVSAIPGSKD